MRIRNLARRLSIDCGSGFWGLGLVEPIDDFRDEHPCVNEDLMDFLAEEMIRGDFNIKEFLRMVLYSETYQREATDYELTSGELYLFPRSTVGG